MIVLIVSGSFIWPRFTINESRAAEDPAIASYMLNIGPITGSVTANYIYATIFNPATSSRTVVITRLAVKADANAAGLWQNLTLRRITAVSTTLGTLIPAASIPKKNTTSTNSILNIRYANGASGATLAGNIDSRMLTLVGAGAAGASYSNEDLIFGNNENIVLKPGEGIALYQEAAGSAAQLLRVLAEWQETSLAPAAQGEYLISTPPVGSATAGYVYGSFFNPASSSKAAIVKRLSLDVDCNAGAVYTNTFSIRRTTSSTAGTLIASANIPKKNSSSSDSLMEIRYTNATTTWSGTADSRLLSVAPCGAANEATAHKEISFTDASEKLILQPGQGVALYSESAGSAAQLAKLNVEWQETSTPAAQGEYLLSYPKVAGSAVSGYVFQTLFNPSGSGKNITIRRLEIRSSASAAATYQPLTIQRITTSTGGTLIAAANIPLKNSNSSSSVAQARYGGMTVAYTGTANARLLTVTAAGAAGQIHGQKEIIVGDGDDKLLLKPGEGIALYQEAAGSANQYVVLSAEWSETAAAPVNNNEYVITSLVTGNTGNPYYYVSFFNPASSSKTVVVKRFWLGIDAVGAAVYIPFIFQRVSTATAGTLIASSDIPKKNTGSGNSNVEIRTAGPTVTLTGGSYSRLADVQSPGAAGTAVAPQLNGQKEYWFQNEENLILRPGEGVVLYQGAAGSANLRTKINLEWQETSTAPAAQGEYLLSAGPITGNTAANYVYATIYNPTSSIKDLIVKRIGIRAGRNAAATAPAYIPISIRRITAASGGTTLIATSTIPQKNSSSSLSVAEVRLVSPTVTFASVSTTLGITRPGVMGEASGFDEKVITLGDEIVLHPGEGLALYQETAAGDANLPERLLIEWQEGDYYLSAFRWFTNYDSTELGVSMHNYSTSTNREWDRAVSVDPSWAYISGFYYLDSTDSQWRIEKRSLKDNHLDLNFGINGAVLLNPSPYDDRGQQIVNDNQYIYVTGYDQATGSTTNEWRTIKLDKVTGAYAAGFGSGGAVTSSIPGVGRGVKVDNNYMYLIGTDSSAGNSAWRIEKRDKNTGSLVAGFGTGGAIYENPSAFDDDIFSLDLVGGYLYIGGWDFTDASTTRWRIEKRDVASGTLAWVITENTGSGLSTIRDVYFNNNYLYIVGSDFTSGSEGWRIEKRNYNDGSLVTGFGTGGVISENPGTTSPAVAWGVRSDGTNIYIGGYDSITTTPTLISNWRIEKRLVSNGSLVSGFGTGGVVEEYIGPAWSHIRGIDIDAYGIYLAGAGAYSTGDTAWRYEKRSLNTGNLGDPIAAINQTTSTLDFTGEPFRLRLLVHIDQLSAPINTLNFKLQFAGKGGGTCAAPTGTPSVYTDITSSTVIAFKDNYEAADKANYMANIYDPYHASDTSILETYNESNNFYNSVSPIAAGQDGIWDFALFDNGNASTSNTTYCFRIVGSNGQPLDGYLYYPAITTAPGILGVDIVDAGGGSAVDKTMYFSQLNQSISSFQTSTSILGTTTAKIRVTNTTVNPSWSLTLAAVTSTGSTTANWIGFNDPTNNYFSYNSTTAGQLTVDPTSGISTPKSGCNNNGISFGSKASYLATGVNTIGLATAGSTSSVGCYWDFTNIGLTQTVPPWQDADEYQLNMILTLIAN